MEHAVLPVAKVAFNVEKARSGDLSEMSAEEWLSFVHHEAAELGPVVRGEVDSTQFAGNQTAYMPSIESVSQCPAACLPTSEWEKAALKGFVALGASMTELCKLATYKERRIVVPLMKDGRAWERFCFGPGVSSYEVEAEGTGVRGQEKEEVAEEKKLDAELDLDTLLDKRRHELAQMAPSSYSSSSSSAPEVADVAGLSAPHPPSLRLLLQFDQCMCQRLLRFHISWLQNQPMSKDRGAWLYALLARLEEPLHQDMEAALRSLYRRCCLLRATATPTDQGDAATLATLNLCIVISGRHFRQGEEYAALCQLDDE
jgi:survival of motor neuron protein-interacting protein 1